jgi:serine/threonine-protein kinase
MEQARDGALPKGTRLRGDDFVIKKRLGQGGFGITYRSEDTALRRPVAIKEFFPEGCGRADRA